MLPPQQMVISLSAGHIDGFCTGEPRNNLAVNEGYGWIAARSGMLAPVHPEKVLMVQEDFARERHGEHMGLLRALESACDWCANPANRRAVAKLLAQWSCIGLSEKLLFDFSPA